MKSLLNSVFVIAVLCLSIESLSAFRISGSISLGEGAGTELSGVDVRISNVAGEPLQTDVNGDYAIDLPNLGKPHMVAPRKTGYTFEPAYFYIEELNQAETINFLAKPVPTEPVDKKMIYYYINWGIYARDYNVRDIPVENITHINYAFLMPFVEAGTLQVGDNVAFRVGQTGKVITVSHTENHSVGLVLTDEFADIQKYEAGDLGEPGIYPSTVQEWLALEEKSRGVLGQLIQLKKAEALKGKDLKLVASVGGWTLSQHFPAIAENPNFRKAFAQACLDFLEHTGFDGIDLDWEFPLVGGTDGSEQINGRAIPAQPHREEDPVNLLDLFKDIREAIGEEYELSIACAQAPSRILSQYVWPGVKDTFNRSDDIMDYLDYVNTMTYDYGGYWSPSTSHNAPLYKDDTDPAYNGSIAELIDLLLAEDGGAVSPEKLIMGLGYYGRAVKGVEPGPNGDGLYQTNPYSGPVYGSWDVNIPDREAAASLDFADLKFGKALNKHHYINQPDSGFVEYWNDVVKLPYLYNPNKDGGYFVSYDDESSLAEKVRFLNSRNLGGAMVWEITQDSKDGYLTQIIYDELISAKANISGQIIGVDNLDLSGIVVQISSDNFDTIEWITGADGGFSFENLDAGKDYVLTFSKAGTVFDVPTFMVNQLASDRIIQVHASDRFYSIEGVVENEGSPLEAVDVYLWIGNNLVDHQISSSRSGAYRFLNLPAGFTYTISAQKPGYANSTGTIEIYELASDQFGINFNFQLAQYRIFGTVKNNFDQPLQGARVLLSGDAQATLTTDELGHYTTPSLEAMGSYTLEAIDGDKVFMPSERTFNALDSDKQLDFVFEEIPTISGYLKDGDLPVPNIVVVFSSQVSGWYWVTTRTDDNGYFEFVNVPLGEESSYFEIGGWQGVFYPSNRVDLGAITGSQEYLFNLDPNYVEGFDVDGYVRSGDGNPNGDGQSGLVGVQVIALDMDSLEETRTETDENGYYQFKLEKDRDYRIRAEKEYYAFSPEFVAINQLSEALTLEDFQGVYLRASISGRVVFEEEGLPNVLVQLSRANAEALSVETDSQGYFEFKDLEKNAAYILWFSKPYFNFSSPFLEVSDLSEDQNFGDLPASFSGSLFSISGSISDESDLPMEGVQVFLSGDKSGSLLTDLKGEFAFDDLMEGGSYQITFSGESLFFTPQIFEWDPLVQDEVVSVVAKESTFTPLPEKVIVGYWHNWDNPSAPHIPLREVAETKYNVCDVSFIETWKVGEPGAPPDMPHAEEGAHPKFSVYNHGGEYTEAVFKEDVQILQASGIPVLISIGGQNGHVELNTEAEKDIYVQGVIDIVEEYGFDGIDIDYEGGSMTILNSPSDSLEYAAITDPELKYGIDAIREIKAYFGDGFLITTAPELYYVQEGRGSYPGGSQFIAFLHNIRDILDLIHVQYYNFGTALWSALDGTRYNTGDVDLVVAMTDMLITGFPLTNGLEFPGLREDQVAIGLPCVPNAAGGVSFQNPNGYYFPPAEIIKALNYLTKGIKHSDLDYSLEGGPYPNLRGIMTWSINWDKSTDGGTDVYEFANAYDNYFASILNTDFTELGTPYYWYQDYGFAIADGSVLDLDAIDLMDSDGDGYANFKEYIFGTSPVDKTSAFKLSLRGAGQLNWEPVLSGRSYELQWTDNLMHPFQTIEVFQSTTKEYINRQNSDQSKGFYRIQVKMND